MKQFEIEFQFEKFQERLDKFLDAVNNYKSKVNKRLTTLKNRYKNPNDNQIQEINLLEATIEAIDLVLDRFKGDVSFALNIFENDEDAIKDW